MSGYQPTADGVLHADLLLRRGGQPDLTLGSLDGYPGHAPDDGGATAGSIGGTVNVPATPAACGDLLVLVVKVVSGTSDYIEIGANISIP